MRDDEDTVPVTAPPISKETDLAVVVLIEVVAVPTGGIPLVDMKVYADLGTAEVDALHRFDVEMASDQSLWLHREDRIAARQRWLADLRRGKPMPLTIDRTIRMRPEKVRESV